VLRLLSRKQGERHASVLTAPGRAILYLNLCATDRLSRVVRSFQVLSCPVISRPALPACYMLCLLPACQLDTTAHLPGASHRHPCNFPFPLMLANSKPRSPAIYQFGVHPIYREPHIVGRFGRISRLSHRICACVKPLMSSASPHYSG
jgi:hypothetical protein